MMIIKSICCSVGLKMIFASQKVSQDIPLSRMGVGRWATSSSMGVQIINGRHYRWRWTTNGVRMIMKPTNPKGIKNDRAAWKSFQNCLFEKNDEISRSLWKIMLYLLSLDASRHLSAQHSCLVALRHFPAQHSCLEAPNHFPAQHSSLDARRYLSAQHSCLDTHRYLSAKRPCFRKREWLQAKLDCLHGGLLEITRIKLRREQKRQSSFGMMRVWAWDQRHLIQPITLPLSLSISLSLSVLLCSSLSFSVLLCPSLSFSVLLFPSLSFSVVISLSSYLCLHISVLLCHHIYVLLCPSLSVSVLLCLSLHHITQAADHLYPPFLKE